MRQRLGPLFAAAASVVVLLAAGAARGQHTTTASRFSAYEKETIERVLGDVPIEPAPEGKIIESIEVVPIEVIEDRDPAPRFLNVFHVTTRASVIRREVLLDEGEPYQPYRVDETVRVLRTFQQLSLVLAVPVRGTAEDRVKLVIVTKDVWSLRSQFDIKVGAGGLDALRFEPTERNVFGTLNSVVSRFELLPESFTLGGAVFVPRVGGRRIYLASEANVIVNRSSGDPEGTHGEAFASTPQVTATQEWTWGTGVSWRHEIIRRYVGGQLVTYDAPSTVEVERVPDAYRGRALTQSSSVGRSFGLAHKRDVAFGLELNVRRYRGLEPGSFEPPVIEEYLGSRVPRSDTRVAPFVQLRFYESRFLRIHDLATLGLQEDYRVGYDVWVRAYPVSRAAGSSRDFVGSNAFAQYVLPIGDGFARASGETLLEIGDAGVPTAAFAGNASLATPRFVLGRLVVDAMMIARPENYLNRRSTLGGEGRLRGLPSAALIGQNVVSYNAELRTRPVEILSCQIGGAVFFDVGDAFDGPSAALKSSAGLGVRALFPQLDRKVFRVDVAFPMVRSAGVGPVGFYIAFEQAFPAEVTTAPGAGASQAILNSAPGSGALGQ